MAFVDYWSEVQGDFPRMDQALAQRLTQRAWRNIMDLRQWSFNFITNMQWFTPMVINVGTIAATFNTTIVALDATAQAAVLPFVIGNPPFAGPTGVGYQIRLGSLNTGISTPVGPLYSVLAYNASSTVLPFTPPGGGPTVNLTQGQICLDRPYGETTVTGAQYLAYKAYYAPPNNPNTNSAMPATGFFKWTTLRNVAQGYDISGKRLLYTQEQLNRIDPQRAGIQDAYIVAQWGRGTIPGAGDYPIFEAYPHPTSQATTYVGTAMCKWGDLSAGMDIPSMPYALSDLVVTRAKVLGCQWAMTNVGTFPELAGSNWVAAQQVYDRDYKEQRIQCIKEDDEINPLTGWTQDGKFDFPLGGEFLQSHDISSLVP